MSAGHDRDRADAARAVRITVGLERVRTEAAAFFAVVAAAPDRATAERWTTERFGVDAEVAAAALDQPVRSMMPRRAT